MSNPNGKKTANNSKNTKPKTDSCSCPQNRRPCPIHKNGPIHQPSNSQRSHPPEKTSANISTKQSKSPPPVPIISAEDALLAHLKTQDHLSKLESEIQISRREEKLRKIQIYEKLKEISARQLELHKLIAMRVATKRTPDSAAGLTAKKPVLKTDDQLREIMRGISVSLEKLQHQLHYTKKPSPIPPASNQKPNSQLHSQIRSLEGQIEINKRLEKNKVRPASGAPSIRSIQATKSVPKSASITNKRSLVSATRKPSEPLASATRKPSEPLAIAASLEEVAQTKPLVETSTSLKKVAKSKSSNLYAQKDIRHIIIKLAISLNNLIIFDTLKTQLICDQPGDEGDDEWQTMESQKCILTRIIAAESFEQSELISEYMEAIHQKKIDQKFRLEMERILEEKWYLKEQKNKENGTPDKEKKSVWLERERNKYMEAEGKTQMLLASSAPSLSTKNLEELSWEWMHREQYKDSHLAFRADEEIALDILRLLEQEERVLNEEIAKGMWKLTPEEAAIDLNQRIEKRMDHMELKWGSADNQDLTERRKAKNVRRELEQENSKLYRIKSAWCKPDRNLQLVLYYEKKLSNQFPDIDGRTLAPLTEIPILKTELPTLKTEIPSTTNQQEREQELLAQVSDERRKKEQRAAEILELIKKLENELNKMKLEDHEWKHQIQKEFIKAHEMRKQMEKQRALDLAEVEKQRDELKKIEVPVGDLNKYQHERNTQSLLSKVSCASKHENSTLETRADEKCTKISCASKSTVSDGCHKKNCNCLDCQTNQKLKNPIKNVINHKNVVHKNQQTSFLARRESTSKGRNSKLVNRNERTSHESQRVDVVQKKVAQTQTDPILVPTGPPDPECRICDYLRLGDEKGSENENRLSEIIPNLPDVNKTSFRQESPGPVTFPDHNDDHPTDGRRASQTRFRQVSTGGSNFPDLNDGNKGCQTSFDQEFSSVFNSPDHNNGKTAVRPSSRQDTSVDSSKISKNCNSVAMELAHSSLPAPPKVLSEIQRTSIGLPPTFSRLPPDGHEFPQTYSEPNHITNSTTSSSAVELQLSGTKQRILNTNQLPRSRPVEAPPLPKSGPPTAGPRKVFRQNLVINVDDRRQHDANLEIPSVITTSAKPSAVQSTPEVKPLQKLTMLTATTTTMKNGKSDSTTPPPKKPTGQQRQCAWRKDEKSEKSVRDKIAMFSNDTDAVDSPNTGSVAARKLINRSVDNLLSDEFTGVRGKSELDHSIGLSVMTKKALSVEHLDEKTSNGRYSSTYENNSYRDEYMLKAFSVENLTNPNGRVENEVKTKPKDEKKASIPLTYASLPRARPQLVARTTSFSGPSPNQEERRRSSISNLLEQRKKSMSKLRGLVIPEKTAVGDNAFGQVIFDLPEIKSKETAALPQSSQTTGTNGNTLKREPPVIVNYKRSFSNGVATPSEVGYTSIFTNSSSTLRATVSTSSAPKRPVIQPLVLPPVKPPRTSLISSGRSSSDIQRTNGHLDDSDSDSVFSAKISSPPGSPVVQATPGKFALTRTLSSETNTSIASSTTSTLTSGSGSQASCSSLGSTPNVDMSRKISKSSSNDSYANRKNILALAKCRSGKDDSGPLGHRQRRPYEDEDSTDGYEEEEVMRHHAPKPKQRSLLALSPKTQAAYLPASQPINYRLVTSADNAVDMVINVASYVEVTSDTDADSKHSETSAFKINTKFIDEERRASFKAVKEAAKSTSPLRTSVVVVKPSPTKVEENNNMKNNQLNTDMSQWIRTEVARSKHIEKPTATFPSKQLTVSRNIQKFNQGSNLETPKTPQQATFTTTKVISVKPATKSEISKPSAKLALDKPTEKITKSPYHERFSSLDSLTSSSSSGISSSQASSLLDSSPIHMQSSTNDFGSFSSFGSNHSLITPADLQLIIEEADPPLKRAEAVVVVMQRDSPECSVGVTLAGGADYETKEITIHRVLTNSPAYKDGRLRKGDRILSINGLSMRGLTHRESVAVLKTPRLEVVMVVTRSESLQPSEILSTKNKETTTSLASTENGDRRRQTYAKQSPTLQLDLDVVSNEGSYTYDENKSTCGTAESTASSLGDELVYSINQSGATKTANRGRVVEIFKDNCGLGLAIEGGLDSPNGHCPLTVKKVFMGGAAEKTGQVRPGDIIVAINDFNTEKVTRVQAWNFMKSLPCGSAKFHLTSS